ncbi:MAG: type II toxin-antitoxin system RelE/ParE family toxin [Candidatus Woesearchaeota archaeon]
MSYNIVLSDEAVDFLFSLDNKSKSICKKNLQKLVNPYPGRGPGDKEKLIVAGEEMFRLHIGRSYTSFYIIDEKLKTVRVLEILSIESAHKKYGF